MERQHTKPFRAMPLLQLSAYGGADVGEVLKLQMQKIEELTLYMIELKKENEKLKQEFELIKK